MYTKSQKYGRYTGDFPQFSIVVTWQLIVTLDSIRNSCDVLIVTI